MAKKPFRLILSRLVDLKPEEVAPTLLLFFYFFLLTTSTYIIIPVKISLYLKWLSFEKLPYAYLLTALMIGFVAALNSTLLRRMKRHLYISLCLVFFSLNLVFFWWLFGQGWSWGPMVFWFWEDIFVATSIIQFWILINDFYTPRQARRLVGFLVSGGLLGGVAGALLASSLAQSLGTENLLLICPVLLAICLLLVNLVHRARPKETRDETRKPKEPADKKRKIRQGFGLVFKDRHLRLLSGIIALGVITTTVIDFQFNALIEQVKPDEDARTAFLGTFFVLLLIFSYFLHVFSTNRLLKNFGLQAVLLIAPVFLLAGTLALFFLPAALLLPWAVLVKGGDKSLAHSLNQSVRELLYIPIPPEIKYKVKMIIDMFVNKFSKGLAAVLILLLYSVLHFSIKGLGLLTLLAALTWIIFSLLVTREYVNIVKKNLKIKWQDADRLVSDVVDLDMTKLVFDTLQSRTRSSVLYAMNLFDLIKKERLSPELKKIISYKSDEVRASSMDSLLDLDGQAFLPEVDDSLDQEALGTQVNEIMSLDIYQELMKSQLEKILTQKGKRSEISRMEAAKFLGMMSASSPLLYHLKPLLRDESPEVIKYAIESAGKIKKREFIPLIMNHLSSPSLYRVASEALAEYGTKIIGTLKDYLSDPEEDRRIRKKVPEILAHIGTQRAADVLSWELNNQRRDLEPEIIEAMCRLRKKNPQFLFLEKIILPEAIFLIKKCYLILMEIKDCLEDEKKAELAKDLEGSLARNLKQIFELLSLIHPQEDILKAYQNISAGTRKATDFSLELLENVLKKEVKEFLFPLIDDLPFDEKIKKCKRLYKSLEKDT